MFIIATCGFGIPMSWKYAKRDKNGRLSTQQMISEVANGILIRSRAPSWLYKFGFEKFGHFCSSWKSVNIIFSIQALEYWWSVQWICEIHARTNCRTWNGDKESSRRECTWWRRYGRCAGRLWETGRCKVVGREVRLKRWWNYWKLFRFGVYTYLCVTVNCELT